VLPWLLIGTALLLLTLSLLGAHRAHRRRLYQALAASRGALVAGRAPGLSLPGDPRASRDDFARERFLRVEGVLDRPTLEALREEALAVQGQAERTYIPNHKQGGTLAYEQLHRHAPRCLALYHAPALREWLSQVIGARLQPTADHDQSSCSLLYYTHPGDHIGWHFDHNFYRGRHFTVLIALENRGGSGGISAAQLQRRLLDGEAQTCDTAENVLVVFEGKEVLHRATPLGVGERRILLSMTFGTDPRVPLVKEWARRIKDTAFFGLRALWD
jgi:hypothetical protein